MRFFFLLDLKTVHLERFWKNGLIRFLVSYKGVTLQSVNLKVWKFINLIFLVLLYQEKNGFFQSI